MHKVFYSASAIALLGLAACTSTSTQPLPNGDPSVNFSSLYNSYISDGTLSIVNNEPVLAVPARNQNGSATMSGAMANTVEIDNDNDVYIIGNVAITADFDAQTITGNAGDFGLYDIDNCGSLTTSGGCASDRVRDVDGSLALTGTIDNANATFDMDANGTLNFMADIDSSGNTADTTINVNGFDYDGSFGVRQNGSGDLVAIAVGEQDVSVTAVTQNGSETSMLSTESVIILEED